MHSLALLQGTCSCISTAQLQAMQPEKLREDSRIAHRNSWLQLALHEQTECSSSATAAADSCTCVPLQSAALAASSLHRLCGLQLGTRQAEQLREPPCSAKCTLHRSLHSPRGRRGSRGGSSSSSSSSRSSSRCSSSGSSSNSGGDGRTIRRSAKVTARHHPARLALQVWPARWHDEIDRESPSPPVGLDEEGLWKRPLAEGWIRIRGGLLCGSHRGGRGRVMVMVRTTARA